MKLLKDNEKKLHRVAKELLKYETIDGNDLDKIMAGKRLRRRRPKSANGAKDGKAKESASKTSEEKKVAEKSA